MSQLTPADTLFEPDIEVIEEPLEGRMVLNVGPQHPSTHGVLRMVVELEGERIVDLRPVIGYLHTGIEKEAEFKTYAKSITFTDRMSYVSPLNNELAYMLAVERLMDVEVPKRAQYIRVLLCELDRLASHLIWLGTHGLELGAMSVMLYCFRERETILDIMEMVSGQRMMASYFRFGGLAWELPDEFETAVTNFLTEFPDRLAEYEALLTRNPIWVERTKDIGHLDPDEALALGVTGPMLRASGVDWDLRRDMPYSAYDEFDFDVAVNDGCDVYARYLVRLEEMRQSVRIAWQGLEKLEGTAGQPIKSPNRKVTPPPREELDTSMEAVIHHFKLWTEGFKPPVGEAYAAVEAPRGELGFYIVSDGSGKPYRWHMRSPSFANLQSIAPMAEGGLFADLIAIGASLDPIMGEVDR
ncbi:MAG: NADH-quinone oxidoreductase subunit 4 [Anaerolineales bacterium]|nr:NADH-quinone oxidoreductase subunit 4 [Anaerolineales bacterium]